VRPSERVFDAMTYAAASIASVLYAACVILCVALYLYSHVPNRRERALTLIRLLLRRDSHQQNDGAHRGDEV
jgi:hypothetical protein